jgi:hypothetical protein
MRKYQKLLLSLLIAATSQTFAQNVGINTTTPDVSAVLEIKDTHKGLLIPRVHLQSVTDAITISTPAVSLLIYNTNPAVAFGTGYYFNNGTTTVPAWKKFISIDDVDAAFAARGGYTDVLSNTSQVLNLDSEDFDVSDNFLLSSSFVNPNTFIAPVKGIYHFDATIKWEINGAVTTITIDAALRVNGVNRISFFETNQNSYAMHINSNVLLNAGDKVTIVVGHNYSTLIPFGKCYFSGNIIFRL